MVLVARSRGVDREAVTEPKTDVAPVAELTSVINPASVVTVKADISKEAIKIFDALLLRPGFGETFAALGFQGEDSWRAAARIRIAFLPAAADKLSVKHDEAGGWWSDPDVCWLTGLHHTKEGWYCNKELYEQLLWWSALPELMKTNPDPAAEKSRLQKISKSIETDVLAAQQANYRLRRPAAAEILPAPMVDRRKPVANGTKKDLDPEIATEEREVVVLATSPSPAAKKK
jgi:hypothetical protein